MSVYQEREFPFLKEECQLLEAAVRADIRTLGVCLGAQLTAKALGSKIVKAPQKEVGWYNVRLTAEGRKDSLFKGLGEQLRVFQWHEDTFELPGAAVLLAESEACRNQAFRYGHNVYALQFHLEVDGPMIENWFDEYSPEDPLKRTALSEFRERSAPLQKQANRLYENFFGKKGAEAALRGREGGGG
jgi:GMP synthase-like glutamine amidotransferase